MKFKYQSSFPFIFTDLNSKDLQKHVYYDCTKIFIDYATINIIVEHSTRSLLLITRQSI